MKKTYMPAEVEIIVLETEDVLKVSNTDDDFDINDGKYDEDGWV